MLFQGEMKKYGENMEIDSTGNELSAEEKDRKKKWKERIGSFRCSFVFAGPRSRTERELSEKASFRASLKPVIKASLALETALVLPLFFLGMLTMICFMDVYQIQTEHLRALCDKAKQAGMYAYMPGGGGPEEITLPDVYAYKPVGGLIPLPTIWMHNTVKVHAWTGREYERSGEYDPAAEEMVYVTEHGTVYHRSLGCSYLNLSVSSVPGTLVASRRNRFGEAYSACEICSWGQEPAGIVYITEQGNRYHNLESCSGLKRTVRLIKRSEVGNMAACSRCGGG